MIQIASILHIAIYGCMISYLLSMKQELSVKLNLSDARQGYLFSVFMFVGAVLIIFLSPLIDIFGHRLLSIIGFIIISISAFILASSKKYTNALIYFGLFAIGGMLIISIGNTLLPLVLFEGKNAPAATSFGNVFYGVGAFAVSLSFRWIFEKTGFKKIGLIFCLLFLLPLIFVLTSEFPALKSDFSFEKLLSIFTIKYFWIAVVANFFAAGTENGVGAWVNTYMIRNGASEKKAGMYLSLFFVAIMVSRLISVFYLTAQNTGTALIVNAILAISVIILLIINFNSKLSGILLLVAGLFVGPTVPAIFGYLFSKIDPGLHGSSFGICFAAGLFGASISPGLVGLISNRKGLSSGFLANLAFAICLLIMSIVIMIN